MPSSINDQIMSELPSAALYDLPAENSHEIKSYKDNLKLVSTNI